MMLPIPSRSPRTRQPGFALIIALMLMVFLVLLMTSLASLVRVDLQTAGSADYQQIARQNARFGLQLAMAELQRTAGPDQRVTARADIVSNTATNPHWTGVWSSTPPITHTDLKPVVPSKAKEVIAGGSKSAIDPSKTSLISWLVSGNENKDTPSHTPASSIDADFGKDPTKSGVYLLGAGTLVGKRSTNETDSTSLLGKGAVTAPKVPLYGEGTDKTGHYAWWVGDEGVKARIQMQQTPSVVDKTATESEHFAFQLPSASDLSILGSLSSFDRKNSKLKNILNFDSLYSIDETNAPILKQHWHDLSPYSTGLLTDTRWGGFRGDLTLAFENDSVFENYFGKWKGNVSETERFYFVDLNENDFSTYGVGFPNWLNLRSFYKLKDRTGISNGTSSTQIPAPLARYETGDNRRAVYARGAGAPYKHKDQSAEGYHENSPLQPLLARLQVTIGIDFEGTGEIDVDGQEWLTPVLKIKPLVAFYNPYNVTLTEPRQSNGSVVPMNVRWAFVPKFTIYSYEKASEAKFNVPYENDIENSKKEGPFRMTTHGVQFFMREVLSSKAKSDAATSGSSGGRLVQGVAHDLSMRLPNTFNIQPGETRLFGLWRDFTRPQFESTAGGTNRINLDVGEAGSYQPLDNYLRLALATTDKDSAFEATAHGGRHDQPSTSESGTSLPSGTSLVWSRYGLTPLEKEYLRVKPKERLRITIDSERPGAVWVMNEAQIEGVAVKNGHLQFFSPVAESEATKIKDDLKKERTIVVGQGTYDNLFTWGFWLRGASDGVNNSVSNPKAVSRPLVDHNVRAMAAPQTWDKMNDNFYVSSVFTGEVEGNQEFGHLSHPVGNILNTGSGSRFSGYWGGSASANHDGVERVVLFDVPRSELLSLGALQHANIGRYQLEPSYIIGNSFPPARLSDLDKIVSNRYIPSRNDIDIWDLSYLINQQLWDSYYFSTIPQGNNLGANDIQDLLKGSKQLPNHRLRLIGKDGDIPTPTDLTNNSVSTDTFYEVAANLVVDGAFNINSTSKEAWKALLASSRNLRIPVYNLTGANAGANPTFGNAESDAVYSRLLHPVDGKTTGGGNTFWTGYRTLSTDEIDALAEAITTLIKGRGAPFSSLAEFVNRPLEKGTGSNAKAGLLQEAIDRAEINKLSPGKTLSGAELPSTISHNLIDDKDSATAFPGYLTQADILQILGPILTARSDTFTIRSYGDALNPTTGQVEARAWCEAVVQRVPFDATVSDDYLQSLSSSLRSKVQNKPYLARGAERKFRVVAFRWLTSDEI